MFTTPLQSHMEVPMDAFAAIGDGGNDLSMIELAGESGKLLFCRRLWLCPSLS